MVINHQATYKVENVNSAQSLRLLHVPLLRYVLVQKFACTPGLVVPTQLIRQFGGFPNGKRYAEDFELFIKLNRFADMWVSVGAPRCVFVGKHLFASGRGLSSNFLRMQIGTFSAIERSLRGSFYYWLIPIIFIIHLLKFIRRMLIIWVSLLLNKN